MDFKCCSVNCFDREKYKEELVQLRTKQLFHLYDFEEQLRNF